MSNIVIPRHKLRPMLSELVMHLDYDLWKGAFNADTLEEPEETDVDGNFAELEAIVESYGGES